MECEECGRLLLSFAYANSPVRRIGKRRSPFQSASARLNKAIVRIQASAAAFSSKRDARIAGHDALREREVRSQRIARGPVQKAAPVELAVHVLVEQPQHIGIEVGRSQASGFSLDQGGVLLRRVLCFLLQRHARDRGAKPHAKFF